MKEVTPQADQSSAESDVEAVEEVVNDAGPEDESEDEVGVFTICSSPNGQN